MAKSKGLEFPLLGHIDELVESMRENVPMALKQWDVEAIHDSRVATRRLKAATDLLRPVLTPEEWKTFGKALRKLRRRLGPLRDIDVMLEHLGAIKRDKRHAQAAGWLIGALERQREAARKESAGKLPPAHVLGKLGAWWGLREEVAEAREAVDHLLAESLHEQLDDFTMQADQLAGKSAVVEPSLDEKVSHIRLDPHQLRIAGKALRYTLEMAVKEGHRLPGSIMKAFKKMQECLGLWHDCVVLADRMLAAAITDQLGHHDASMQMKVLDLSRLVLKRSVRELEKFHGYWAEKGENMVDTIRTTFPLTRPVDAVIGGINESKMDPDPSGSEPVQDQEASSQSDVSAA